MSIPIIDSHIHLFPASDLESFSWYSPSTPLNAQHSIAEYRRATSSTPIAPAKKGHGETYLRGFVFLETDRKSSVSPTNWTNVLDEISFLARIISGSPIDGQGHTSDDKDLCLAIMPWAPVPGGPAALETYLSKVKERIASSPGSSDVFGKIKGFRYLVQDKPAGTMLEDDFVQGLKWLGRNGYAFDLGVDARTGGLWQLEEAVDMMRRVCVDSVVKVIINHLCKPNLRLSATVSPSEISAQPDFMSWKTHIFSLSRFPHTYMKLSGLFSELPPLPEHQEGVDPEENEKIEHQLLEKIAESVQPWTDAIFDNFSSTRVMFGSDWPVCNIGGGGNAVTWGRWKRVVEMVMDRRGLGEEGRKDVWYRTAQRAYNITI